MNILYGIQLNGNGHITRSIELIDNLLKKDFTIDIIASGNNSDLNLPFSLLKKYRGLSLYYDTSGKINWWDSVKDANINQLIKDTNLDTSKYDLVISDFEPVSAWSAYRNNKKCINISNQNSLLSNKAPRFKKELIANSFLKYFAYSKHRIGLHYKEYDQNIYQPIISNKILESTTSNEDLILVYLPAYSLNFLKTMFKQFTSFNWIIYSKESKLIETETNVTTCPLNLNNFQKDLVRCSGVITASGFTTTSEALVLNKKLWSIPIKGQYEQICNSKALQEMGIFIEDINSENIKKWLEKFSPINYTWNNPINSIINKIIEIYED